MTRLAGAFLALSCAAGCTTEAPTPQQTQAPPTAIQPTSAYLNYSGRPDLLAAACG